jgi:chromosome segregation ATPase
LKESKLNFKEISNKAQASKIKIDSLVQKLEQLKHIMGDQQNDDKVIEEEEFALIKELKDLKKDYKAKTNFLKQTKSQIQHLEQNVINVRMQFINITFCLHCLV